MMMIHKAPLAVLMLLSVASGSAQDEVMTSLVVSATKMNVLYRGIENPLEVAVPGKTCDEIQVSVSQGRLEGSGCSYTVIPDPQSKQLAVEARWMEAGEQRFAIRQFRVKEIPLPIALFAGKTEDDTSIRRIEAMAAQGIVARVVGIDIHVYLLIERYRSQVLRDCAVIFDGTSEEARLTEAMREALSGIKEGDIIHITEITAKYPSGNSVELRPLWLLVK